MVFLFYNAIRSRDSLHSDWNWQNSRYQHKAVKVIPISRMKNIYFLNDTIEHQGLSLSFGWQIDENLHGLIVLLLGLFFALQSNDEKHVLCQMFGYSLYATDNSRWTFNIGLYRATRHFCTNHVSLLENDYFFQSWIMYCSLWMWVYDWGKPMQTVLSILCVSITVFLFSLLMRILIVIYRMDQGVTTLNFALPWQCFSVRLCFSLNFGRSIH